uniref:Uncharacterized protein n=1 Tax=Knipowitschia caucasica TaxID=637954 RepID=A0AAV2KG12_KNICA
MMPLSGAKATTLGPRSEPNVPSRSQQKPAVMCVLSRGQDPAWLPRLRLTLQNDSDVLIPRTPGASTD